ncbi:MAG: hypothetical protein C4293_14960 [Nitrospiraceae bacterium]
MNDGKRYPVNYYFGVFNGAGPNFTRLGSFASEEPTEACPGGQTRGNPFPSPAGCPTNQRNLNANTRTDIDLAGRLNWNIMGRPGYSEGDLAYSETPQMAVGADYAFNPGINTSTNNAFVGIDPANFNFRRQLAAFGNGRQLGWGIVDYSSWSLDYVFKYRGFSFQAEYYFKNVIRHEKGLPCLNRAPVGGVPAGACTAFAPGQLGNATGWYAQSGYFLIPRTLELAGRYAYWDPDTRSASDLVKEIDVALTYYINSTYDHTITVQYTNLAMGTGGFAIGRSAPLPPDSGTVPLDVHGGTLIENAIRIQYQIFF